MKPQRGAGYPLCWGRFGAKINNILLGCASAMIRTDAFTIPLRRRGNLTLLDDVVKAVAPARIGEA
eukprot:2721016-Heterocapsa_arctica.AAC.1